MYILANAPIVAAAVTVDITLPLPPPLSVATTCQSEPLHAAHSRPMLQAKKKKKLTARALSNTWAAKRRRMTSPASRTIRPATYLICSQSPRMTATQSSFVNSSDLAFALENVSSAKMGRNETYLAIQSVVQICPRVRTSDPASTRMRRVQVFGRKEAGMMRKGGEG